MMHIFTKAGFDLISFYEQVIGYLNRVYQDYPSDLPRMEDLNMSDAELGEIQGAVATDRQTTQVTGYAAEYYQKYADYFVHGSDGGIYAINESAGTVTNVETGDVGYLAKSVF